MPDVLLQRGVADNVRRAGLRHNAKAIGRFLATAARLEHSMPAYLVTFICVTDPEMFRQYRKLAVPAVAKYGGRFLVRDGARTLLEGRFDDNELVLIEFPSVARARIFYDSPEYQAARDKRIGSADFNMMIVEGVDG